MYSSRPGTEVHFRHKVSLGLDVHAETIALAVAKPDREVWSLETIPNRASMMPRRLWALDHIIGGP
jgi:hypothetical protein